ncbi:MAG: NUDIX domain-containing protein [Chloroflexi bacterium]|nr:MAG: NUDIX domain-containing protein [Chloroflexota bacterium]
MSYVNWIRGCVGSQQIFLVFATVILEDENGRILLQRRTDFDFWGLPGGVLEPDEDIESCARRELLEETGLSVGALRLVGIYSEPKYNVVYPNGDQVQQFTVCLAGRVNGGKMQADGVETVSQCFVSLDEAMALPLPVWYRDMLADYAQGKEPIVREPVCTSPTVDQITQIRPFIGHQLYIGPGAMVLVVREDGRFLMIERADEDNFWGFPAGFSDLGENVSRTAQREVYEETGLIIQPERILGVYSAPDFHYTYANGDQIKNVGVLFRARPIGGHLQLDYHEVRRAEWVTPAEAEKRITLPPLRRLFQLAITHLDEGYFIC